jgi:replication-associated recombination protein RarA
MMRQNVTHKHASPFIEKIMNWINDVTNPQSPRFMWMYGPAGSGKSAIAQTIAEICEREGITIASFFFSRTVAERNHERSLISTLAYQIYLAIPEIRDFIAQSRMIPLSFHALWMLRSRLSWSNPSALHLFS